MFQSNEVEVGPVGELSEILHWVQTEYERTAAAGFVVYGETEDDRPPVLLLDRAPDGIASMSVFTLGG